MKWDIYQFVNTHYIHSHQKQPNYFLGYQNKYGINMISVAWLMKIRMVLVSFMSKRDNYVSLMGKYIPYHIFVQHIFKALTLHDKHMRVHGKWNVWVHVHTGKKTSTNFRGGQDVHSPKALCLKILLVKSLSSYFHH